MKRLINNLIAIVGGCTLIYGVNDYLIPFNTEESAMAFTVMALVTVAVGMYGIISQLVSK
tara:strand:+ start:40 stop:219 length:180 start_codon:yes stop_codon:yes gene_type:complete